MGTLGGKRHIRFRGQITVQHLPPPPPPPRTISDTCNTTEACWPHYHHLGSWLSTLCSCLPAEPENARVYSEPQLFSQVGTRTEILLPIIGVRAYSENSMIYGGIFPGQSDQVRRAWPPVASPCASSLINKGSFTKNSTCLKGNQFESFWRLLLTSEFFFSCWQKETKFVDSLDY